MTIYYAFKQSESDSDDADERTASTGWETMLSRSYSCRVCYYRYMANANRDGQPFHCYPKAPTPSPPPSYWSAASALQDAPQTRPAASFINAAAPGDCAPRSPSSSPPTSPRWTWRSPPLARALACSSRYKQRAGERTDSP